MLAAVFVELPLRSQALQNRVERRFGQPERCRYILDDLVAVGVLPGKCGKDADIEKATLQLRFYGSPPLVSNTMRCIVSWKEEYYALHSIEPSASPDILAKAAGEQSLAGCKRLSEMQCGALPNASWDGCWRQAPRGEEWAHAASGSLKHVLPCRHSAYLPE